MGLIVYIVNTTGLFQLLQDGKSKQSSIIYVPMYEHLIFGKELIIMDW